jgi:hypothetical protein
VEGKAQLYNIQHFNFGLLAEQPVSPLQRPFTNAATIWNVKACILVKKHSHHIPGDVTVVLKTLTVFAVMFLETPMNGKSTMHRLSYRDYQVRKTKLI